MGRPVEYYEYGDKPNDKGVWEYSVAGTAEFHQWGTDYEEFETGPGQFSTAIIELPDGTVKNHPAHLIRFKDK